MICQKCGHDIPDDSYFCPYCGEETQNKSWILNESVQPQTDSYHTVKQGNARRLIMAVAAIILVPVMITLVIQGIQEDPGGKTEYTDTSNSASTDSKSLASENIESKNSTAISASVAVSVSTADMVAVKYCDLKWDDITSELSEKHLIDSDDYVTNGDDSRSFSNVPYKFYAQDNDFENDKPVIRVFSDVPGTKITDKIYVGMTLAAACDALGQGLDIKTNPDIHSPYAKISEIDSGTADHYVILYFDDDSKKVVAAEYQYDIDDLRDKALAVNYNIIDNTSKYTKMHLEYDDDPDAPAKINNSERADWVARKRGVVDAMLDYNLVYCDNLYVWRVRTKTDYYNLNPHAGRGYYEALLDKFNVRSRMIIVNDVKPSVLFHTN